MLVEVVEVLSARARSETHRRDVKELVVEGQV